MMSLPKLLLFVSLAALCGLSASTYAQEEKQNPPVNTIPINRQRDDPVDLQPELFEDTTGRLTIEDVSSAQFADKFVQSAEKVPNFGYTNSTIWVRLQLRNEDPQISEWMLEYRNPRVQRVAFYVPQPHRATQPFQAVRTGTLYPFYTRSVPSRHFVFKLQLPYDTQQTVYLQLQGDASLSVSLALWPPELFLQESTRDLFIIGFMAGIYFVITASTLFAWSFLREKSYLYYVMFGFALIMFQASYNGTGSQYLWPNQPWLNRYMLPFAVEGLIIFPLLFGTTFLQTKTQLPRLHKLLKSLLYLAGFLLLEIFFVSYRSISLQLSALLVISYLALILAVFSAWRQGYKPARYFLLAWGAASVTMSLTTASLAGLLPFNILTQQSSRPSSALLFVLLPLALADQINLARRERAEALAAALHASNENDRLTREQNVFLEQQVALRTAELVVAKEHAEKAQKAAEAANRAKDRFLANMSHELRTPLNAILGYIQIFHRQPPTSQSLRIMEQSGQHLLALIEDLLDLARIDAGKVALQPTTTDLPNLLQAVAAIIRPFAEQKGLTFRTELSETLPPYVTADAKRLRQILLNLLDNAVKFTEVGHVTLSVVVRQRYWQGVALRVTVKDSGIGIAVADMDKIQTPFYRTEQAEQQADGTGLGLALTQKLLALMGSSLVVESVEGVGTVCWFDIELAVGDGEDRGGKRPLIQAVANAAPHLLIVDDKWENRAFL
ncbi:MAG: hypothetical protein KDE56_22120, partial [Anaerolineales bacterium]|nr:hypothetical protein [Anaerolineales bacterium]